MAFASGTFSHTAVFDDFHQPREGKFKRDGGEFLPGFRRHRVGRRDGGGGDGDARPAAHRGVIAQRGGVGIARPLDVREPVARLGMHVNFVERMAFQLVRVNPQNQVAVRGFHIQSGLLLARQIPLRVKPVRVARGQGKFLGAVGLGQFGFRRFKMRRGRRGAEREFFAGTADGRRRGRVAFQQNRRDFDGFAADRRPPGFQDFFRRAHGAGKQGFAFGFDRRGGGDGGRFRRLFGATLAGRACGLLLV